MKCGEKRMAHRKFDAWQFPKPAVCGIFHSPRNSENCRIAHVHVQTVGLFNPRLVFGAHVGHSVWECMVSERLSPCQVPVSFISPTHEHVPQGGAKMCPNTIALLNNIFNDNPTVSFIEVKVEGLDVDSVLVVLVVHWQHIKTHSINSGRQKFRSPSIVQENGFCFCFHLSARLRKAFPPWCALSQNSWGQSSSPC